MENCFLEAVQKRRSIYGLNEKLPFSDEHLIKIIETAVKNAPSAFNSQSSRVVILLGENNGKFWKIVEEALARIAAIENFAATKKKIQSFAGGHGTILFFEDEDVVRELQKKFEEYKDNFPIYSQQANGMLQYMIWTLLAENDIGASLQHYNPIIDQQVKQTWNLPENWKLIAQMPFGNITQNAGEKSFLPLEDRIKVFY